jgi:hypothetical protein
VFLDHLGGADDDDGAGVGRRPVQVQRDVGPRPQVSEPAGSGVPSPATVVSQMTGSSRSRRCTRSPNGVAGSGSVIDAA